MSHERKKMRKAQLKRQRLEGVKNRMHDEQKGGESGEGLSVQRLE